MAKTVLVTGGSRGIGFATAELFARSGWRVALCSRKEDEARKAAAKIGKDVIGIGCDIGSKAEITRMFAALDKSFPVLDALINNAGILHTADVFTLTDAEFDDMMQVNVTGLMHCSREAFARMKKRGGSIVNISSIAGIQGVEKFPGLWAYGATKFAVVGLTEGMALEGRPYKIRVNCIAPGATDTDMLRKAAPDLKAGAVPMDIAKIAYYLSDYEQSAILTGTTIPVFSNA